MAFTQKLLSLQFDYALGNFAEGGNTLTTTGLRTTVKIVKHGGAGLGHMEAEIYGMTLSQMNQLTTFGASITSTNKSKVTVTAGDSRSAMTTIFQGTIQEAWMDASAMPEVAFRVAANAGEINTLIPVPPTSVQGQADVAKMMSNLAQIAGLQFENNNVNVKLANPYFPGSARTQMLQIAQAAGIGHIIDNGTLAIWPAGMARQGPTALISKDTILVGYPGFNSQGVVVKCLWDPSIVPMGSIQVQSDITPANGTWTIYSMDYDMASMMPGGPWFVMLSASKMSSIP